VLNIGGISNITLIQGAENAALTGFDCGPGNALMDAWCKTHIGAPFDDNGAWAAGGQVIPPLLERMLTEPFFARQPPKSTGRDLFNGPWLQIHLQGFEIASAQDVQATLTELTARACAQSVLTESPSLSTLIVCGGGALNGNLLSRLTAQLPACKVASSEDYGLPALQVEATAFAWLAQQAVERKPGNVRQVTGALGERVLGAVYPAQGHN
jgi:anhydro-N-acetylmuramic acid kinase